MVPLSPDPLNGPAWFYTRGSDSVRIEVRHDGARPGLLISGPGRRREFIPCAGTWTIIECQIAEETSLLAQGYVLDRFTDDRGELQSGDSAFAAVEIRGMRERFRS